MIDFKRNSKGEDTTADISPPRHVINNGDAGFNWDEDVGINESSHKREKGKVLLETDPVFRSDDPSRDLFQVFSGHPSIPN